MPSDCGIRLPAVMAAGRIHVSPKINALTGTQPWIAVARRLRNWAGPTGPTLAKSSQHEAHLPNPKGARTLSVATAAAAGMPVAIVDADIRNRRPSPLCHRLLAMAATAAFSMLFRCENRLQRSRRQHLNQPRRGNIGGRKPSMNLRALQVLHGSCADLAANYVGASLAQQFLHHAFSRSARDSGQSARDLVRCRES